jgi:hypothetical protein
MLNVTGQFVRACDIGSKVTLTRAPIVMADKGMRLLKIAPEQLEMLRRIQKVLTRAPGSAPGPESNSSPSAQQL